MTGVVISVGRSETHSFSKPVCECIRMIEGVGVEGDAHSGATVQHLARMSKTPELPNLRQVHVLHAELLDELNGRGFFVRPGDIGENVTTRGVDLLGLPTGSRLHLGAKAVVEITGLRNPCGQLDDFQEGLKGAVLDRDDQGNVIRKSGVMGTVITGGDVRPGDPVRVELPPPPHTALVTV